MDIIAKDTDGLEAAKAVALYCLLEDVELVELIRPDLDSALLRLRNVGLNALTLANGLRYLAFRKRSEFIAERAMECYRFAARAAL